MHILLQDSLVLVTKMRRRCGIKPNKDGVLDLKIGQILDKKNLWVGTKSASGPVVHNTKEAIYHYYTW